MKVRRWIWLSIGLVAGSVAGWWLRGYSDIDACLDAGGRWQYGGSDCEGIEVWMSRRPDFVARAQTSLRRGISSTKLQGRLRASSCSARIPSHPSFTAPLEPGSAKI